jgi:hypothetical protein
MKKLKFVLLLSFSLLFNIVLTAQDNIISLKYQKIKLPDSNFYVLNFVDARNDTTCIGYFFGGSYTNKLPIIIESGLSKSLQYLMNGGGLNHKTEKMPLSIKINKLFIYQLGGENDYGDVLEINLDFYVQEGGKHFHEFTSARYYTFNRVKQNENIDDMIVKAIEDCYTEFLHRMNNNWGYHREIGNYELKSNSLDQKPFVSTISNFKQDAIYYTFNDFRDNLADTLTPFELKQFAAASANRYAKFKSKITDKGSVEINEIWGAQYNGKLYIQVADYFIPVIPTKDMYIIKNMTTFERHNYARKGFKIGYNVVFFPTAVMGLVALGPAGIFFPSVLLGLAGGGIGAGIGAMSPKIKILNSDYQIDEATGMPVPIKPPAIKIQNQNERIDTLNVNAVIKEEKPIKASGGNPNELFKRGSNVFIEIPDVESRVGEKYFVKALEEWGYWNVVKNKYDADFIIVFNIDEKIMGDRSACVTIKTKEEKEIKKSKFYRSSTTIFNGYDADKGVANKIVEMYLMAEFN